jgi:GT2 family glycosyltransferase
MSQLDSTSQTYQSNYGDRVSSFKFSEVDIIIPFHGQYNSIRRLVENILLYTKSNPYLITLVDDASPNAMFLETIKTMAPVRTIRLNEQRGFAGALKAAYDSTLKPWCVFMHSDCLVQDQLWLQRLGESALRLKDKNVRLIHSRTDNPQCDHSVLKSTAHESQEEDVIVTEDDPLPLICGMVHRQLFDHIGGFLKQYPYGGYEDVELFYRMKKHGMKQAVCGLSWVHHEGGLTMNEIMSNNKKAKDLIEANYDLCMADLK